MSMSDSTGNTPDPPGNQTSTRRGDLAGLLSQPSYYQPKLTDSDWPLRKRRSISARL
jgi:hypothetical protein